MAFYMTLQSPRRLLLGVIVRLPLHTRPVHFTGALNPQPTARPQSESDWIFVFTKLYDTFFGQRQALSGLVVDQTPGGSLVITVEPRPFSAVRKGKCHLFTGSSKSRSIIYTQSATNRTSKCLIVTRLSPGAHLPPVLAIKTARISRGFDQPVRAEVRVCDQRLAEGVQTHDYHLNDADETLQ